MPLAHPAAPGTVDLGSPDQANRLSSLSYDHGDTNGDGTRSYTYDAEGAGRIMTASYPGGFASYRYDPFGRRYSKTVNGVTTVFLHDEADNEIAEFDGNSGAVLRYRLYSRNSVAPVVSLLGDGYTGEAYPALDRLGSVVSTSDGNGQYLSATSYLPYGQSRTGAPPPGAGFGYAGYRYDAETGLYYVRNRYYDPRLGRWLQPDPIGQDGGVNLYAYVGNDPLNATDPLGLAPAESGSGVYTLIPPQEPGLGSPCLECIAVPALRLPRALGALYDAYQATRIINNAVPNGADNVANAPRLTQQLQQQSARSPFTESGTLTPEALANSREIIPSAQIGNQAVPSGFSKYTTQTYQSPLGDFQVHFYRNPNIG